MHSKTVLITGASSGIGAALAQLLSARGASLALVARREKNLSDVADRCGERALAIVTDVTHRDQVQRAIKTALTRFGQIDVLVNNAGQGITRVPSQLTDSDIDDMMRINVKSVLYGMQEILPHFKSCGSGLIINISSMLGRVPYAPYRAAYTGAKHYLNALTTSFRDEVQATHPGIQVSLISPGVVATDFGSHAIHGGPDSRSLPYPQDVEEVAEVIAGVIQTPRPDVYTRRGSQRHVAAYFENVGADP